MNFSRESTAINPKYGKLLQEIQTKINTGGFSTTVQTEKRNILRIGEPRHEISNNVVCVSSKCSDQPAHTRSLIRAFACRLNIL